MDAAPDQPKSGGMPVESAPRPGTASVLAVVVVGAILADSRDYTDTVMALAVVSFFGTVAFARYLVRGRPVD